MKKILVELKERTYPIIMGSSQKALSPQLLGLGLKPSKILIISSPRIQRLGHVKHVEQACSVFNVPVHLVVISDGEHQKNLGTLSMLYSKAISVGLDRQSLVVAVGGGVVTDLVGFFAATYMRGLSFVSVPTTLLAMVDAAIGGKTGVDLPQGKNLIGAFWQPRLVWIDPQVLSTLPQREWRTGMAEVIKYGVISQADFFVWLEKRLNSLKHVATVSESDLSHLIYISAKTKAQVVSSDEKETPLAGGREILNFGHTLGHALEAATNYTSLTHGEAISIGMIYVGRLALSLGFWNKHSQERLYNLLRSLGLPVVFPNLSRQQEKKFWEALKKDKKHVSGQLRFVLPVQVGKVKVQSGIDPVLIKKIIQEPI